MTPRPARAPGPRGEGRAWAIVAGGGTAGHVVPGVAIAGALVARGHPRESIHFVGSARGVDSSMVPEAGFGLTLLPGRGFARQISARAAARNLGAAWGLTRALLRAAVLVRRKQPAVVVAVGGYAGVPCGLAAVVWRLPLVVVEQNAVPGAANRLLGRFARACAVSFADTDLPRAVVTGNPVRPEILAVDTSPAGRASARAELGIPEGRKVVAVTGGSLGARRVNDAIWAAVAAWTDRSDLAVRHAVGSRDWELVTTGSPSIPPGASGIVYEPVEFERRMDLLLAAADVIVCRAGGNTVAEIAVVGVPAVLVPLPNSPGDHQTANARLLVDAGAAVVVPDGELDGERLVAEVDALLAQGNRLADMSARAAATGKRDAADRLAALVEEHARR